MNILLSWARRESDPDIGMLTRRLTVAGHTLVYFIGAPIDARLAETETVFHCYADAEHAKPAPGIDTAEFEPLGEDIIKKLYRTESIALTMMNRLFDTLCVDERRRIYYEMVRYWRGALVRFRPDAIIFPNMPHLVYDYIIYELAHLFGIKTILFDDTRFPGRLLPLTNLDRLTERIQEARRTLVGSVSLHDLASDIRRYYEPRRLREFAMLPSYIVDQEKKYTSWTLGIPWMRAWHAFRNGSILRKGALLLRFLIRERIPFLLRKLYTHASLLGIPDLKKEYGALVQPPRFNVPFVYFPLQKQPERSTSPQGDIFVDQILALELLSYSLPEGTVIYVKEHPLQWLHFGVRFSSYRYRGYYRRIASIKGVTLVPLRESSYRLINDSLFVSAVTGSAGWEAALRGKLALIFGKVWYENCPGVYKAASAEDCRATFERAFRGFRANEEELLRYLKCFELVTIRGFIAATSGQASTVGKEECMDNISAAVLAELHSSR